MKKFYFIFIIFYLVNICLVLNTFLKEKDSKQKNSQNTSVDNPTNNNYSVVGKLENVEIRKSENVEIKSDNASNVYARSEEVDKHKTINAEKKEYNILGGYTENPNILSPVIQRVATSVTTPIHPEEGSPSYDLELIKNHQSINGQNLDSQRLVVFSENNSIQPLNQIPLVSNMLPKFNNNIQPIEFSQIPQHGIKLVQQLPVQLPNIITHQTVSTTTSKGIQLQQPAPGNRMNQIINNQYPNINSSSQILNLSAMMAGLASVETKIKNNHKLSNQELSNVINQLVNYENTLIKTNDEIYKKIKKYEAQNNVILDSLKDEIYDTNSQLLNMIVEVPTGDREIINKEIEEEFSKSLAGYSVNKGQFSHLNSLDPKELIDISARIKAGLESNDRFYLHGNLNFLS